MWPQGWIYGAAIALLDGQSHKMELLNGRVLTQKIADFPILWKYLVRWRGTNLIIWLKCVVWWTNNDSPRILLQVLGLTFFSVCTFFLRMSLNYEPQKYFLKPLNLADDLKSHCHSQKAVKMAGFSFAEQGRVCRRRGNGGFWSALWANEPR